VTLEPRAPLRGALPLALFALSVSLAATAGSRVDAQGVTIGSPVGAEVKTLYERGLAHLVTVQAPDGSFQGIGVTGIAVMAFLASGEDPNHGRYAESVHRALRSIIVRQNGSSGYFPSSMYDHGFALLALAEAYGAVDESLLTSAGPLPRSIAEALELGVRCAVTSQEQNPSRAWRYAPESDDADTSVSGAVLMGLLAARNAGIEVPDRAIDSGIEYFVSMTSDSGTVAYSAFGGGDSLNRSAIALLVYSVAKRKSLPAFAATLGYLSDRVDQESGYHPEYFRYYMAQALYQADPELWRRWSRDNTQRILELQADSGAIGGFAGGLEDGSGYTTAMLLLSVALEFRFLPIYER
jgi:hypothetical protein